MLLCLLVVNSFLLLLSIPFCAGLNLFICPTAYGHLGHFQAGAVRGSAIVNILVCVSWLWDRIAGSWRRHISDFSKKCLGTSLVAQWLRIRLPMQGTRVRALVREDPTCRGATKPVRHSDWACALEPTSHNYWAHVLQLLKPACLEPVLRNKFPGGTVIKTLHFHCRRGGFNPWWGTKIPHALWCSHIINKLIN